MVAPHHVDAAVAETRRMVGRGFRAIFMRPNVVHGRNWHDPHYDPLWAEAERLGMAVCFHEGGLVYLPQVCESGRYVKRGFVPSTLIRARLVLDARL